MKKKTDNEKKSLTDLGRKALFDAYEFSYEVTEAILQAMDEKGVSKADFAREMGVSRSYVTQLLEGSVNITFRKFVEVCHALDVNPRAMLARRFCDFAPKQTTFNVLPAERTRVKCLPSIVPIQAPDGLAISTQEEWADQYIKGFPLLEVLKRGREVTDESVPPGHYKYKSFQGIFQSGSTKEEHHETHRIQPNDERTG